MEGDTESLAHLEVQIKFADDLCTAWAVNGYSVDWEVGSFEGPFGGGLGRDHDGKRVLGNWNDFSCIVTVFIEGLDHHARALRPNVHLTLLCYDSRSQPSGNAVGVVRPPSLITRLFAR